MALCNQASAGALQYQLTPVEERANSTKESLNLPCYICARPIDISQGVNALQTNQMDRYCRSSKAKIPFV